MQRHGIGTRRRIKLRRVILIARHRGYRRSAKCIGILRICRFGRRRAGVCRRYSIVHTTALQDGTIIIQESNRIGIDGPFRIQRNVCRISRSSERRHSATGTIRGGVPSAEGITRLGRGLQRRRRTVGMRGWIAACVCS